MDCSGCGFEVEGGYAFCPRCGRRQPVPCASCGYPCAPDFEFCPKCGASVGAPAKTVERPAPTPSRTVVPPSRTPSLLPNVESEEGLYPVSDADRRTVTVLFADLCGFTTLSEQLDPEVMQALQNELFKELT
ncbi:MAG: adenylate/guanylate cyclase domain-containing protein, partial [Mesorhizobium sp.]